VQHKKSCFSNNLNLKSMSELFSRPRTLAMRMNTTNAHESNEMDNEKDGKGLGNFEEETYFAKSESSVFFTQTDWRVKEKMKTHSIALLICLNIGVDPPDIIKPHPCAKTECGVDPNVGTRESAMQAIAQNLKNQYEVWQSRGRYKILLSPKAEDVRKLLCALRKSAKDERVMIHYNGHGVPKPTNRGEIWVFNKEYSQYIPLSIRDIHSWIGSPSVYVFDCSAAGNIVDAFIRMSTDFTLSPPYEFMFFGACKANQILPMHPDLPADLFTCCLTAPIEIAIKWFILQNNALLAKFPQNVIDNIPGKISDRRTPLGEMNWIFTSITDTIAWNLLPNNLFKKLFRQDQMVAALFRNFLLADRIMRSYGCIPISYPELPPSCQHHLWDSWDLALDMCLSQIASSFEKGSDVYVYGTFFNEHLTAFEVWLERASENRNPPEQLPIVLQVVLSSTHRLRALILLGRFVDLGPWAVNHCLAVGIFPYILKLLQSSSAEIKMILVFIWTRILAVDKECQQDLLKDDGFLYFINILSGSAQVDNAISDPLNKSELFCMCVFALSVFCDNYPEGQASCMKYNLIDICISHLEDPFDKTRLWTCICLGQIWKFYPKAKKYACSKMYHHKLYLLLSDHNHEVRASALYALGCLVGADDINTDQNIGVTVLICTSDASHLVRLELVLFLEWLIAAHSENFVTTAYEYLESEKKPFEKFHSSISHHSFYSCLWKVLLSFCMDPYPAVVASAFKIVDEVNYKMVLKYHTSLGNILQSLPEKTSDVASKRSISYNDLDMMRSRSNFETYASYMESLTSSIEKENTFFEKSKTYFQKPRLKFDQKPKGTMYCEHQRQMNKIKKSKTSTLRDFPFKSFMGQTSLLENQHDCLRLMFHPFRDHLVVSGESVIRYLACKVI
jgi:regulator-associated protein of mTOR